MSGDLELLVGLVAAICGFAVLARKIGVPTPILLVVAGVLLGFVPGLPQIELDPELVLLLFLPPLVYVAALGISWREFYSHIGPIALLAIGCVIFTALIAAYVTEFLIPPLPLAAAFVLGAAVSPPDAVAATSLARKLGIPRRLVTILEGEGVVNDATALTFYRFAVIAATTGAFSLPKALVTFSATVLGEIAWGLAIGWICSRLWPRLKDVSTEVVLSLTIPYLAYLVPERLGGSGVLATVTAAIFIGSRATPELGSETRIRGTSVWTTIDFVFSNLLFFLTGLQLRSVLADMRSYPLSHLVAYGAVVAAVVILIRFIWVFPATYLPRLLFEKAKGREPSTTWRHAFLVAFTGMRGGVSLAAALAVPLTIKSGEPFPARDLIVFFTFSVILVTLVFQGLTLPMVIRWLGLDREGKRETEHLQREEFGARITVIESALKHLPQGEHSEDIRQEYTRLLHLLRELLDGRGQAEYEKQLDLRRKVLDAERKQLAHLRAEGHLDDEVLRNVQKTLDFSEARLISDPLSER